MSLNVHDSLKDLSVDDIKQNYINNANSAAIAMTHVESDFNLSNVIRSANFLGFREVFYIGGKKQWDRRGSVGTHNYIPVTFCKTIDDFIELIGTKYIPIALENNINLGKKVNNIYSYEWPINPVIVCGEEQNGIPVELLNKCKDLIEIPARGTVRSLNVATAAGIAMSLYTKAHYN